MHMLHWYIETNKVQKECYLIRQYNIKVSIKLNFSSITYLFVSVALICLVLYLKKKMFLNFFILYCLVLLNSVLF